MAEVNMAPIPNASVGIGRMIIKPARYKRNTKYRKCGVGNVFLVIAYV
jgi:hypothetical protein